MAPVGSPCEFVNGGSAWYAHGVKQKFGVDPVQISDYSVLGVSGLLYQGLEAHRI